MKKQPEITDRTRQKFINAFGNIGDLLSYVEDKLIDEVKKMVGSQAPYECT